MNIDTKIIVMNIVLTFVAFGIVFWLIRLRKTYNQEKTIDNCKNTDDEEKGREITEEERIFVQKVMEDYCHNIAIVLSGGNSFIISQYRQQPILIQNEVVVQIEMVHNKHPILTNCYFSGKIEIFYKKNKAEFQEFNIGNITKALKDFGFKDVGFANM